MQTPGSESWRDDLSGLRVGDGPPRDNHRQTEIKDFASTAEMLEFIAARRALWPADPDSQKEFALPKDVSFFGTRTWAETLDLAVRGWPDGRRRLVETASRHIMVGRERRRSISYDVAGAAPDVPRFLGGDPACMMDWPTEEERGRPVIRLSISPICDREVDQQHRANWGAALVSWIEAEEMSGIGVEIDVIYVTWAPCFLWDDFKWGPPLVVRFPLKRAADQLPLSELAFWLMHNAAHRRIQFAVRERLAVRQWYGKGHSIYGLAVTAPDEIRRYLLGPSSVLLVLDKGATSVVDGLRQIDAAAGSWKETRQGHATDAMMGSMR